MNIAISGYGRMGKIIHQTALEKMHTVSVVIDKADDWKNIKQNSGVDVVIDFSLPDMVVHNIEKCFDNSIPIVVGTTGWYDKFDYIEALCLKKNASLFYAPNFSIGVNLFFELNTYLAQLMQKRLDYDVHITETHHTAKLDAPSGTAIKTAEDILNILPFKKKWINFASEDFSELKIFSERLNNIIGHHKVIYTSHNDEICIEHNAKNRKGFAQGAVAAAEWIFGKKGVYSMKDLLIS